MNVLISFGPLIGVVALAAYAMIIRIYVYVKGEKGSIGKYKKVYRLLIAAEIALCAVSFLVPRITGKSYLPDGTTWGGVVINTNDAFKVSYKESKRGYSNTLELSEDNLKNVRVRCSCSEGKVFLQILQDKTLKEMEVTDTDSLLDMEDFYPGRITFTVWNEEGRNIDFELEWD